LADPMIKITVFGATGRTGRAVISLALTQGMEVTAYARKSAALQELAGRVTVVEGSLDDVDRITGAVKHADAVVIAFGPRKGGPQVFCALATQLIVAAMKEQGVRRLVCVTGALIGEQYPSRGLFYRAMRRLLVRKAPHLMLDRDGQETIVMNSGLDWTVFKPPRLMNGVDRPGTQLGPDLVIGPAARTTVGSLATAILGELLGSQFVRMAVFIRS
jgi:putative NADH-flavin reductase